MISILYDHRFNFTALNNDNKYFPKRIISIQLACVLSFLRHVNCCLFSLYILQTSIHLLGFIKDFKLFTDCLQTLRIGECPSNSPFLKNNGAEAPKVPRPIGFKEWRDTRTFSNLKSTHCTLIILLIINLVTKKFK